MKIGNPLDRSTDHGPQNHKSHLDSLLSYVETGVKEGATLVYGGKRVDTPGKYCVTSMYIWSKNFSYWARGNREIKMVAYGNFQNIFNVTQSLRRPWLWPITVHSYSEIVDSYGLGLAQISTYQINIQRQAVLLKLALFYVMVKKVWLDLTASTNCSIWQLVFDARLKPWKVKCLGGSFFTEGALPHFLNNITLCPDYRKK